MSDIEKIKDRVRKLMAYANDGAASEGEIENAMRQAQGLIDRYHLANADFEKQDDDRDDSKMDRHFGRTQSSKFHRWETTLAEAIKALFGCVSIYLDNTTEPLRVNGVVQYYTGKYAGQMKRIRRVAFFGPAVEAAEAGELYTDWCKSIATMGVMRWGGAYRGEGEAYCQGFADALWRKAVEINDSRKKFEAKPLKALPNDNAVTALATVNQNVSLSVRYTALQERAKVWLEEEHKIKLTTGQGRNGSRQAGGEAYREGREHGSKAEFSRGSRRKQLPGA